MAKYKYQIKIHYITGDSYNSNSTTDVLEMEWENLAVAKQNLIRIKEHYTCYNISKSYNGLKWAEDEDRQLYLGREGKDWHVNQASYKNDEFNSIRLKTDNGADWIISTYWIGYFESLQLIEIMVVEEGVKIVF